MLLREVAEDRHEGLGLAVPHQQDGRPRASNGVTGVDVVG